ELTELTIAEARKKLDKKDISAKELTSTFLARMKAQRDLNCYITETEEHALAQADAADKAIAQNNIKSMTGIPVGIKDLFCTKHIPTTAGSHILDGFVPEYESTVTKNLFSHGAIMLGKLNLDEFAMGSANETSYYGPVVNPWRSKISPDKKLVAGGSSGGSSAAVAASLCMAATGTDTGGSIRQPAAFTGIVGLKPTYGRCSRLGIVAFASSLDQAGPMTKTVEDAAIMLGAMAGHDALDSTSANRKVPDFTTSLKDGVKGLKIGIPKEYFSDDLSKDIVTAWTKAKEHYQKLGAEIVDISLPHTKYALPTYYIIAPAEASSNLARYDGVKYGLRVKGENIYDMYMNTRGEGFGEEVKRRIMVGTYVLSAGYYDAYYRRAQKVRTLIRTDFENAFQNVDVILTPATPSAAFEIGQAQDDPTQAYLNDIYTVPVNLAGLPALSLPMMLNTEGLPLSVQLIGRAFDEETLLRAAHSLEQEAGFQERPLL
ncbi:MAG: Asp-tRNA(Asn)/Glu-tRNA(Gln) amidotransferase subunit GatA, partial [Pseudomonadota bacterium]